jgi:PadR family transcriptional regulator, regulatory protein AphA
VSTRRLTTTSYAVLGLVESCQPATPYDLKQAAQVSLFHFWSIPHTVIYSESRRLAEQGFLSERQEEEGRRRRVYRITAAGKKTLDAWIAEPPEGLYELRDPGLLKLFFGADPKQLAPGQLEAHGERLRLYEGMMKAGDELPEGMRLALEAGIGHERDFLLFWRRMAKRS